MTKVCLCMIVKNETLVLKRCLASVKRFIDTWVIIDTGSTDGTQEMIQEYYKGTRGTLLERPWKNFEFNRNEAIEAAKKLYPEADYLYFIDADEELHGNIHPEILNKDAYSVMYHYGDLIYPRLSMVSTKQGWLYKGVLHEHLHLEGAYTSEILPECHVLVRPEGARSRDPQKFQNDVKLLEDALKEDPTNTRYIFYLAQSQRDAGDTKKAMETYSRRASKGGWTEEVWYSRYQCAALMELNGYNDALVIEEYLKAYNTNPERAEVPGKLARLFRRREEFNTAIMFAKLGLVGRYNGNSLFVEKSYYDWVCLDEFAISSYWAGYHTQALQANKQLLVSTTLPSEQKPRIMENLAFCTKQLS